MDGLKNISSIDNANGSTVPQAVNFYNYDNLLEIDNDIKELRSRHNFELISSSDLANMNLTVYVIMIINHDRGLCSDGQR